MQGSGHMVASDKPVAALGILRKFLVAEDFWSSSQQIKRLNTWLLNMQNPIQNITEISKTARVLTNTWNQTCLVSVVWHYMIILF